MSRTLVCLLVALTLLAVVRVVVVARDLADCDEVCRLSEEVEGPAGDDLELWGTK